MHIPQIITLLSHHYSFKWDSYISTSNFDDNATHLWYNTDKLIENFKDRTSLKKKKNATHLYLLQQVFTAYPEDGLNIKKWWILAGSDTIQITISYGWITTLM